MVQEAKTHESQEQENVQQIRPDVWKKTRVQQRIIELPSGQRVKVKKLNPLQLLRSGIKRPTELASGVFSILMKVDDSTGKLNMSALSEHDYPRLFKIMEAYFIEAVIEPQIVLERSQETEDNICFEDVDMTDIIYLFMNADEISKEAEAEKQELERDKRFFRGKPGADQNDRRGGMQVRTEAERDDGNPGDGAGNSI